MSRTGVTRRTLLRGGVATGAAGALTLATTQLASAAPGDSTTTVLSGHLDTGAPDFVYLPIKVPAGVRQIDVSYTYDKPTVPSGTLANSCDIGIFDERGTGLGGPGFRGWSGGFRTEFSIAADQATPGYLPGPVNAGTWNIALGPYQVAPQGMDYSVTVTLEFGDPGSPFVPQYPPQRVAGKPRGWYRGDCHLHTVYSDGQRTPDEVAAGARAAGLDFMVTTDHNTSSSHAVWGPLAGDDLLIITGEEITTRNGHYLGLGIKPGEWVDWRYRSRDGDYDTYVDQIHRSGGIVVPAHPYCAFVACRWKFGYDGADAVEVWNGPWTVDDESAVDTWDSMLVDAVRGKRPWLPAMGNSDAHSEPQVIGLPQNVVYASAVSAGALTTAIAAGRTWICESSSVDLEFSATAGGKTAGIGERLDVDPDTPVQVTLTVSGVPDGVLRIISDEGQVFQSSLPDSGSGTVTYPTTASLAAYVRAEVRHLRPDGTPGNGNGMGSDLQLGPMAALTNPIFLGHA
jgi:hypothetical protein